MIAATSMITLGSALEAFIREHEYI